MNENTINGETTISGGGATGTLLVNRYRVVRQLGQGGMGSVWLAEDTQLDNRPIAIKMLPSILVANKRAYNQLKSEALVSLKLTHPNIAAVRAFEENGGNPFLVVDYIEGETLDDYLAEYMDGRADLCVGRNETMPSETGLPEDEVIRLLTPIAAALDYAHGEGVVHRDVKPANVMIRKDGHPFILDFGIAREIQETMTRVTGKLSSGTLMYMSPEQLNGDAPTAAQDAYSFAAMTYECLTGAPPFSRGNIEYQIVNKEPEPLAPHFMKCGQGVMAGLAKSPNDRPETCAAVLTGGTRFVASDMGGTRLAAPAGRAESESTTHRLFATVATLLENGQFAEAEDKFAQAKAKLEETIAESQRHHVCAALATAKEFQKAGLLDKALREAERALSFDPNNLDASNLKADIQANIDELARVAREKKEAAERVAITNALNAFEANDWDRGWALSQGIQDADSRIQLYICEYFKRKNNYTKAAKWCEKSAANGNAYAQFNLGWMYANGRGVERDDVEAVKWYRKAAEQGDAEAQCNLGWMYANGRGVAKDDVEAVKWYRRAAEQGQANAQCYLGEAYANGQGVEQDDVEVVKWYRKAAEQGNADAQFNLGAAYANGRGVEQDDVEAMKWYRKAAEQGYVIAQCNLETRKRPAAGNTKTITLPGGAKLELVYCPPGTFVMGSPADEEGRYDDETPHRVTLTKGFWMGKYEVTQKQWKSVMVSNPSHFKGEDRPVEKVSWDDCQEFCRKAGFGLRLPTEAEWEYACRAGTTTAYNFGNALNGNEANCNGNNPYGTTTKGSYKESTCDVGSYRPNAWGLYDMHGNVWEWCSDWYGKCGDATSNPPGPASGKYHVDRGGCWFNDSRFCRSAFRYGSTPGSRYGSLGFRVCCSAGPND